MAFWYINAQITRWEDDHVPGFVECRFTDVTGREWTVIEKLPVVTMANLTSASSFPQPCVIACEIISRERNGFGREIVQVSTDKPWAIESEEGTTTFRIFADQLSQEFPK